MKGISFYKEVQKCRSMMKLKEIRMSKLGIQLYVETSSFTGHF